MMDTSVHRLLDEAFAGLPATPDVQDLKEEIRANLLDRVAELTADGVAPDEAARRAVDELGDVRAIVGAGVPGTVSDDDSRNRPGGTELKRESAAALVTRHRVRPKPGFVVGVVVAALVAATALAGHVAGLVARHVGDGMFLAPLSGLVAALAVGWIVGSSLAQETTQHFALPARRAWSFGGGSALVVGGLVLLTWAIAVQVADGAPDAAVAFYAMAGVLLVAAMVWLTYLGATQTNRRKPWVLEMEQTHHESENRFEKDPAVAARFGIYTVVLWVLVGAATLLIGMTAGWAWAWIPGPLGVVCFMLLLATMLFGAKHTRQD